VGDPSVVTVSGDFRRGNDRVQRRMSPLTVISGRLGTNECLEKRRKERDGCGLIAAKLEHRPLSPVMSAEACWALGLPCGGALTLAALSEIAVLTVST
jgi:hypothetical protein